MDLSYSPRDSQESSQIPQLKSINSLALSFLHSPTLTSCMTTGKTIALTRRTLVGKVMSLLLNMLSRLVINCLKVSKYTSSYGGKIHIFRFDVCESTIRCHQTHSRHRVAVTTDQSRLHHLPQKPPPASSPAPAQETSTPSSLGRRRLEAHRAGGDRVPASCVRLVSQQASSTWNAVLACPSI